MPRQKLQPAGLRCKRPKRNCEIHQFIRLIADRNDSWIGVGYSTSLVFVFRYIVNDVLLHVLLFSAGHVNRADQVDLVILELQVVAVDVYYVVGVVYSKYGVRRVPVDGVVPRTAGGRRQSVRLQGEYEKN